MTHRPIEDLIRDADRDHDLDSIASARLWSRVETSLDQTSARPVASRLELTNAIQSTSLARPTSPKLRVVHRARQLRLYRILSIAAALLVVLGVGWWLASGNAGPNSAEPASALADQIDRRTLEGELELEGVSAQVLKRGLYDGVVVKTGDQAISALRVCSPC